MMPTVKTLETKGKLLPSSYEGEETVMDYYAFKGGIWAVITYRFDDPHYGRTKGDKETSFIGKGKSERSGGIIP